MELVDTRDLKSLDRNIVPVQVRPRVPLNNIMKDWLTATYKINDVNRLEKNLIAQKFNYYLPKIVTIKNNSNPKEELLFPGYIFINTCFKNYSALQYTIGIKNVLKFGDNISCISDNEIKRIQKIEELSKIDPVVSQIQIGQDAVIRNGTFKGNIVKICSMPSRERVVVLLSLLGSARQINILKKDILV